MPDTIRIVLADDHPLVLAGIRLSLGEEGDVEIVGEAGDADQALELCETHRPDVLLLDLSMPGPPSTEVVRRLGESCPATRVLVLTAHDDEAHVRLMIRAGVTGYLVKDEAPENVAQAVRAVSQGTLWISGTVAAKVVRHLGEPADGPHGLTRRDLQILYRVSQGLDNAAIAADLNLSEQTVRNYVSEVYSRIDVKSRAEAIVWARERHVEDP